MTRATKTDKNFKNSAYYKAHAPIIRRRSRFSDTTVPFRDCITNVKLTKNLSEYNQSELVILSRLMEYAK